MTDQILFSGPWIKPPGCVPHRVVLHAKMDASGVITEYIVHDQCRSEGGKLSYDQGDYYPVRNGAAFNAATVRFRERCDRKYSESKMVYVVPDAPMLAVFEAEKSAKDSDQAAADAIRDRLKATLPNHDVRVAVATADPN